MEFERRSKGSNLIVKYSIANENIIWFEVEDNINGYRCLTTFELSNEEKRDLYNATKKLEDFSIVIQEDVIIQLIEKRTLFIKTKNTVLTINLDGFDENGLELIPILELEKFNLMFSNSSKCLNSN